MFNTLEYESKSSTNLMCSENKIFIYARLVSSINKGAMKINEIIKNHIHPKFHEDINNDVLFSTEINGDLCEQDYDALLRRINVLKISNDNYYSDICLDYIDEEIEESIDMGETIYNSDISMPLTLTSDIHAMESPSGDYSDFYTSLSHGDYFTEKALNIDMRFMNSNR